jgi:hypothetical protein
MIPSLFNLMVGGASLLRGWPQLTRSLAQRLRLDENNSPVGKLSDPEVTKIAIRLSFQWVFGACLGMAVYGLMVWAIWDYVIPGLARLLALAQAIEALSMPI